MLSRKNIIKYGSLIYWGIILVGAIVGLFGDIQGDIVEMSIQSFTAKQFVAFFLTMFFIFMINVFVTMISWFELTIVYFGGIVVVKKFYKEKTDITDKKNDDYYRNLLKDYPIGVLGYIKDFTINESEIVGTILSLELKKKISIKDKILIDDSSKEDLSLSESYVLDCLIKKEKVNIVSFSQKVKEDAQKLDLLVEKNDYKKERNKKIIALVIFIFFLILIINLGIPLFNKYLAGKSDIMLMVFLIIIFGSILIGFLVPSIIITRIIVYGIMIGLDPYVRSKKAMQLNEKMSGLENFLKDFSVINERNSKELKLWKDYLIYSVVFEQNKDLEKEILEKI